MKSNFMCVAVRPLVSNAPLDLPGVTLWMFSGLDVCTPCIWAAVRYDTVQGDTIQGDTGRFREVQGAVDLGTIRSGLAASPLQLVLCLLSDLVTSAHRIFTPRLRTHTYIFEILILRPTHLIWLFRKEKVLWNILQYYCMHNILIEEGLLQPACMCGIGLRALASESLWELGEDIILQQVCCDPPDSTRILFSSAIACNQVKTILIWEKSAFAWKYSPHFWLHSALYAVNSQAQSCYVTVQLLNLNLF